MLAVCRGVQGVGGGGIMQLVQISISDIVPLADRAKYMGALGSLWGISSVLGPLIGAYQYYHTEHCRARKKNVDYTQWIFFVSPYSGGLFTDKVTWRW